MSITPEAKETATIKIHNPSKLPTLNYKLLTDFQGTLKTISPENIEKLKRSIIKYGIAFPKAVWKNEGNTISPSYRTIKE